MYPDDDNRLTYETYLVNGFNDNILLASGGTFIPAGRPETFEEDNNASPAVVGRIAWVPSFGGELGFSLHTGLYNKFEVEGLTLDEKHRLTIMALDAEYSWGSLALKEEFARAKVGIPSSQPKRWNVLLSMKSVGVAVRPMCNASKRSKMA